MRLQLLLVGAIAALTFGAVSLTGTAPEASISTLPDQVTATSTETSSALEVATVVTPDAPIARSDAATSTQTITAQPAFQAFGEPAAGGTPAACTAAIQVVPASRGQRGIAATSTIASAIADCIGQLPIEHPGGSPGN